MLVRASLAAVVVALAASASAQAPPVSANTLACVLYEVQPELIGGLAALQAATVYPNSARVEEIEGRVIVQFVVRSDGSVTDLRAVRSPDLRLTEAAFAALRAVAFTPGSQRGRPATVRFAVPVTFRLADAAGE